mmetsp:Transcript_18697/g.23331  ORF Transcript_18697/g.23331 Transcript_18697/m.23331 type:complete len:83 (+) Transcript_18697:218-466(+)
MGLRSASGGEKPQIIAKETDLLISTQNVYSVDKEAEMYDASPKLLAREQLLASKVTKVAKSQGTEVTNPKIHGATKVMVDAT